VSQILSTRLNSSNVPGVIDSILDDPDLDNFLLLLSRLAASFLAALFALEILRAMALLLLV